MPQHLRGERSQADASTLLSIWNLGMDLLQLDNPVLSHSAAHDRLHDQLTALSVPDRPPKWADLDDGVLEQVITQATHIFEQQLSAALQA